MEVETILGVPAKIYPLRHMETDVGNPVVEPEMTLNKCNSLLSFRSLRGLGALRVRDLVFVEELVENLLQTCSKMASFCECIYLGKRRCESRSKKDIEICSTNGFAT